MSKRLFGYLTKAWRKLCRDTRGATVGYVVGIAVSLLVFAILFPIAMTEITGANTTGWNTAVATVFGTLLAVLAVIGVALKYVPRGKK